MTGEEKAALLLLSLGTEVAENVLAFMTPEQSDSLRAHIRTWEKEPPETEVVDQLLDEFDDLMQKARWESVSQKEAPRNVPAPAPVEEAPPPPKPPPKPELPPSDEEAQGEFVAALRTLPVERLVAALQGENSRTVALVLNVLEADRAGEALKRLAPDLRRDATLHLSKGVSAGSEVMQRLAQAILVKSRGAKESAAAEVTEAVRFKKMADMLRGLEKTERLAIIAALEERDPDVAAAIKEHLYHFEDLMQVEDRSMQKLLSEVDSKNLSMALKNAAPAISEKIFNNLSKRARETLTEEMEFLGSVSSAQAQQAQKVIVEVLQRLDQAGEVIMME